MDVLIFGLMLCSFVLIYLGRKKETLISFTVSILLLAYWFSYHATDKLNINL